MANSNGRPEPEVIVNFADGFSYSKGKMEEAFRPGGLLSTEKPAILSTKTKESVNIKQDDVDLIVRELEITRPQAEKYLVQHSGDVLQTLKSLVQ